MGRPRKIVFTESKHPDSLLEIEFAIQFNSDVVDWCGYTVYTNLYMYELPAMKNVIKQLSDKYNCTEENLVIKSITY